MSGNKMLCAVKNAAGSIHLVNKCLVIFMAVLLLQSAYSLFYPEESGGEAGNIDVIVRTSSAAIFGYFLSANFDCRTGKSSSNTGDGTAKALPSTVGEGPKTQIGFQAPSPDGEDPIQMPPEIRAADSSECNPQVIIATVIGLFCLWCWCWCGGWEYRKTARPLPLWSNSGTLSLGVWAFSLAVPQIVSIRAKHNFRRIFLWLT